MREEVKEEVREEVKEEVREEVKEEGKINFIISSHKVGLAPALIAEISNYSIEEVLNIIRNYKKSLEMES